MLIVLLAFMFSQLLFYIFLFSNFSVSFDATNSSVTIKILLTQLLLHMQHVIFAAQEKKKKQVTISVCVVNWEMSKSN